MTPRRRPALVPIVAMCVLLHATSAAADPNVRIPPEARNSTVFSLIRQQARWLVALLDPERRIPSGSGAIALRSVTGRQLGNEEGVQPAHDHAWPVAVVPGRESPWLVRVDQEEGVTIGAIPFRGGSPIPLGALPERALGAATTRIAFVGGERPEGIVAGFAQSSVPLSAEALRRMARRQPQPSFSGVRIVESRIVGSLIGAALTSPFRARYPAAGPVHLHRTAAAAQGRHRALALWEATNARGRRPASTAVRVVRLDAAGGAALEVVVPVPEGLAFGDGFAVDDQGRMLVALLPTTDGPGTLRLVPIAASGQMGTTIEVDPHGPLFPTDVQLLPCAGAFWALVLQQTGPSIELRAVRVGETAQPPRTLWRGNSARDPGLSPQSRFSIELHSSCGGDRAAAVFVVPGPVRETLAFAEWDPR